MSEEQLELMRDKYVLWTRAARQGGQYDDYNARCAEALAELLGFYAEHGPVALPPQELGEGGS